jgi:hypothetical protein
MLQQNGKLTATDSPRAVLDLFDNDVANVFGTLETENKASSHPLLKPQNLINHVLRLNKLALISATWRLRLHS